MPLEPMEIAVLQKLLDGQGPILEVLRHQLFGLLVKARKKTGVGFFTDFLPTAIARPAQNIPLNIRFGDVHATINGLKHGAGFLLYVDNGFIHRLEGYSYDEPWPDHVTDFSLRYSDPDRKAELAKLALR